MKRLVLLATLVLVSCVPQTTPVTPTPDEPTEAPSYNDPANYLIDAPYDLLVAPGGTGDCLTINTPCSLSTALERISEGDRVLLRTGTYEGGQILEVTANLAAYPYEYPVISGVDSTGPGLRVDAINTTVSGITFRYNEVGIEVNADSVRLQDVVSVANSTGIEITGERVTVVDSVVSNNDLGINAIGDQVAIRYSEVSDNRGGITVSGEDSVVEYVRLLRNVEGFQGAGVVRFSVGLLNGTSFTAGPDSLLYNNTSIASGRGFVSETENGQTPSILFNNISYREELPVLPFDADDNNSWNLGIVEPDFISINPDSAFFAVPNIGSPALDVPLPTSVPVGDLIPRLGAFGNY